MATTTIYYGITNNVLYLSSTATTEAPTSFNADNASSSNTYWPWTDSSATLTNVIIQNSIEFNATSLAVMFRGCSSLTSLDLSNFNTSNVTSMYCMFYDCNALTSLNISNFNTSNVTSMSYMFRGCSSLTSLNISNFNTSNVINMSGMFSGCNALTSLNISNFNTSNVINMSSMFYGCNVLTSLNISNFNTSKVTNMVNMFSTCNALTSLNISNFNTSNVTNMTYMFQSCKALTLLNISNFNTSKVTNMSGMFSSCDILTSLDLSSFDTSNVINMSYMFQNCKALTLLNVSSFNTSEVTNMNSMFRSCSSLTSLDLFNFNTSNVTNMGYMFYNCTNLEKIMVSTLWDPSAATTSTLMFYSCSKIKGQNGTSYNSSIVDKTYAKVDEPNSPGYFWLKVWPKMFLKGYHYTKPRSDSDPDSCKLYLDTTVSGESSSTEALDTSTYSGTLSGDVTTIIPTEDYANIPRGTCFILRGQIVLQGHGINYNMECIIGTVQSQTYEASNTAFYVTITYNGDNTINLNFYGQLVGGSYAVILGEKITAYMTQSSSDYFVYDMSNIDYVAGSPATLKSGTQTYDFTLSPASSSATIWNGTEFVWGGASTKIVELEFLGDPAIDIPIITYFIPWSSTKKWIAPTTGVLSVNYGGATYRTSSNSFTMSSGSLGGSVSILNIIGASSNFSDTDIISIADCPSGWSTNSPMTIEQIRNTTEADFKALPTPRIGFYYDPEFSTNYAYRCGHGWSSEETDGETYTYTIKMNDPDLTRHTLHLKGFHEFNFNYTKYPEVIIGPKTLVLDNTDYNLTAIVNSSVGENDYNLTVPEDRWMWYKSGTNELWITYTGGESGIKRAFLPPPLEGDVIAEPFLNEESWGTGTLFFDYPADLRSIGEIALVSGSPRPYIRVDIFEPVPTGYEFAIKITYTNP